MRMTLKAHSPLVSSADSSLRREPFKAFPKIGEGVRQSLTDEDDIESALSFSQLR